MAEICPPQALPSDFSNCIFLAGSIDLDKAVNWQAQIVESLQDRSDLILLNPRRKEWDSSWPQEASFGPFREQVEWELKAQEEAAMIVMYFAPTSKSPITLLELGLFAQTGRLVVCCPEGYWRKGNVDIVCQRYGVPMVGNLEALVEQIRIWF